MATIREIAREAGVSVGTVSRILNGKNKESWKSAAARGQEVRAIARRLGYRPSAAARAMQSRRTMNVGVVIRNNPEPAERFINVGSFESILGMNEILEAHGYLLSVVRISELQRGLAHRSRVFREQCLDGIILTSGLLPLLGDKISALPPKRIWMDANLFESTGCIRRDEKRAGRLAAQAGVELGYRKMLWFADTFPTEPGMHYSHPDRLAGVQEIAVGHGVDIAYWQGRRGQLLDEPEKLKEIFVPDRVIIAYNTYCAHWLTNAAVRVGLRAGMDFGLICCDETHDLATQWPDLCRVTFDRFDMGYRAGRMLISFLETGNPPPSVLLEGDYFAGRTARGPGTT